MRAVARITGTIVLLALVTAGFYFATRVCGPAPAHAGERVCELSSGPVLPAFYLEADVVAAAAPAASVASEAKGGAGASPGGNVHAAASFEPDDELGMHNLAVWDSPDGAPVVYVSFTPVSLEEFFGGVPFRQATLEGREVEVADVAPVLDEAHVTARVDGRLVGVSAVEWYYAGYGDLGGADMKYMPVCLVHVERPNLAPGPHDVHLVIEDIPSGATGEARVSFESAGEPDRL